MTAVQAQSLPLILAGPKDLIAQGQTAVENCRIWELVLFTNDSADFFAVQALIILPRLAN